MSTKVKAKYLLLLGIFNLILYFSIQSLITTSSYNFLTNVDIKIPFIPEFVWVYHSFLPVIILSILGLIKSKQLFFSTLTAFMMATIVLSLFFVLCPSYYPREYWAIDSNSISDQLLAVTRVIDGANNTLPSTHNTFAWLLVFCMSVTSCAKKYKWLVGAYAIWALLITISTLVLKQHYILDVVSGFALAAICFFFMQRLVESSFWKSIYNDGTGDTRGGEASSM